MEDITIEIVSIKKPAWWMFFTRICGNYVVTVRVDGMLMKFETYINDTPSKYNDEVFLERVRVQVWRKLFGNICQARTVKQVTGLVIELKKREDRK